MKLLDFMKNSSSTTKNYTYILECADGSLYCGWTNNLEKRLAAHNAGTASKYTRTRRPVKIIYYEEFLDLYPGSVSVLGLMNDKEHRIQLIIDEDVLKEEMFGCHPCVNTSSIRFATKELTEKMLPALNIIPTLVKLSGVVEV